MYTLKTINRDEYYFLKRTLRDYYEYMMQNPKTKITKFFDLIFF